jgi:hypothetical protein
MPKITTFDQKVEIFGIFNGLREMNNLLLLIQEKGQVSLRRNYRQY